MTSSAPLATDATDAAFGAAPCLADPGARQFVLELPARPASVALARRQVRERLGPWSLCQDTCDAAELVVSELVTNAIVHTASERIVCELRDDTGSVRIAVLDEGCPAGSRHTAPQRAEEEHGRGLLLVSAVCSAWGATETGSGLLVWAELPHGAERQDRGSQGTTHEVHHTADHAEEREPVWV